MQSWIHIQDLARMFLFALQHKLSGNFNAVAPHPISNKELSVIIADILDKPFFLPGVPKILMKLLLGDMHTLLFESQNVSSQKISDQGFVFQYKSIRAALQQLLIK
jgi:NAD dependent epimerase/dehydratase family enzyme